MKFNGWQRIWIVIGILWIVSYIIFANVGTPTLTWHKSDWHKFSISDAIYQSWSYALIKYIVQNDPQMKGQSTHQVRNSYAGLTDKEFIQALRETYLSNHPDFSTGFDIIDAKYKNKLQSLPRLRTRKFLFCFIECLVPLVMLYFLGWSAGWIHRGFKTTSLKLEVQQNRDLDI